MHALGVGLGVLDLSVAQQLERSVQHLYEVEWAGGAADGPGAPPEHALSGASAPAARGCASVPRAVDRGGTLAPTIVHTVFSIHMCSLVCRRLVGLVYETRRYI